MENFIQNNIIKNINENNIIKNINENKFLVYPILLIVYFFFFFSNFFYNLNNCTNNNDYDKYTTKSAKITIIVFDVLLIIGIIVFYYLFVNYKRYNAINGLCKNYGNYGNLNFYGIIFGIVLVIVLFAVFNNLIFFEDLKKMYADKKISNILTIIYTVFQCLLYLFIIFVYLLNICYENDENGDMKFEFTIVFVLILLLIVCNILLTVKGTFEINRLLKNVDLSLLSQNCFIRNPGNNDGNGKGIESMVEKYDEEVINNNLKVINNIPVAFFNKNIEICKFLINNFK